MPRLFGLIPVASHGRLLHNHSLIACMSSSLRYLSRQSLIKQRYCQINIIKTVLLARNNIIQHEWNPKPILHITQPWSHSLIACLNFSLRCISLHSFIKQRKCQITIVETVLPARNWIYSAKQWSPRPVLHISKLGLTTFSLETSEEGQPKT